MDRLSWSRELPGSLARQFARPFERNAPLFTVFPDKYMKMVMDVIIGGEATLVILLMLAAL